MATMKNHFTKCWQCVKKTAEAVTSKAEYSIYDHTMEFGTRTQKLSQTTIIKPHLFHPWSKPKWETHTHKDNIPLSRASFFSRTPDCASFFSALKRQLLIAEICKGLIAPGFLYPNSGCLFYWPRLTFWSTNVSIPEPQCGVRLAVRSSLKQMLLKKVLYRAWVGEW